MKKKYAIFALFVNLLATALLAIPMVLYVVTFPGSPKDMDELTKFATFFSGITTPVFSALGFLLLLYTLIHQMRALSRTATDNKNSLFLPKILEAYDYYISDFINFVNREQHGEAICLSSHSSVDLPQHSFYIAITTEIEELKKNLESDDLIGRKYKADVKIYLEKINRIHTIESRLRSMNIPYYCIEKDLAEINLIHNNLKSNLSYFLDKKDMDFLAVVNRNNQKIEETLNSSRIPDFRQAPTK